VIFEVFRQSAPGEYHTHCGNVHAPDREMATLFAQVQHGRRRPVHSLWVVPRTEVTEVDDEDTAFGGTTDKGYRWAVNYDVAPATEEVADSEAEQAEVEGGHE
jgi:ring-1,2-phenylacetyl-CoA epoxidase subunit PaaB